MLHISTQKLTPPPFPPLPLLGKILTEKPDDAVDILETAIMAKKTKFTPPEPPAVAVAPANLAVAVSTKELFSTPRPTVNLDTGEPEEPTPPNDYETENVLQDAAMYEALGMGLPKKEMYGVMLSMKKLGENPDHGVATARFFGKLLGTNGDYYVFETTLTEPGPEIEVAEGEVPVEVSGTGANTYTYWACSYLGGQFTKLPDCTPNTIKASRQIKRYLTGDLNAPVSAYPPFPGTEKDFLRALVGRIASATVVCPAGYFAVGEEDGALARAEDFVPAESAEMMDQSTWSHRYPHIKEQGRCEWFAFPVAEPEEGVEPELEIEPEASPELLATLEGDSDSTFVDWGAAITETTQGEDEAAEPTTETTPKPAWAPCASTNVPGVKYQVVGQKSLVWPGAFVAYGGGKCSNCYVGYGFQNKKFVPIAPPIVEPEFDLGGQVLDEESGEIAPVQMAMATELPPIPEPELEEGAEGEEEAAAE